MVTARVVSVNHHLSQPLGRRLDRLRTGRRHARPRAVRGHPLPADGRDASPDHAERVASAARVNVVGAS